MNNEYERPELKLVGAAEAVVFGSLVTGSDLADEFLPADLEFESDDEPPAMQS